MKRSSIIIFMIGILIIPLSFATFSITGQAQRATATPVRPTATPVPPTATAVVATATSSSSGGGGSHDDDDHDDDDPTPAPAKEGTVHGYVYDASNGAPQPGVMVVLDGGGWRAETVTNSEGYYIFAGLGQGDATLSLRLPATAHQVTPNLPVYTGVSDPEHTNLSLYWGNKVPLPVLLTASEETARPDTNQQINLTFTVNNRSGGVASDALLDIKFPSEVEVLRASSNYGDVDEFEHRIAVALGDIPTGKTATLSIKAKLTDPNTTEVLLSQAVLNYKEQLTPQMVNVTILGKGRGIIQPLDSESTSDNSSSSSSNNTTTQSQNNPSTSSSSSAETQTLMPTTGNSLSEAVMWPSIVLAMVFLVGLGWAGVRAYRRNSV